VDGTGHQANVTVGRPFIDPTTKRDCKGKLWRVLRVRLEEGKKGNNWFLTESFLTAFDGGPGENQKGKKVVGEKAAHIDYL